MTPNLKAIFYFLGFVILLGFSELSVAQSNGEFGFKGGLNVTAIGGKESGWSTKLGYNVGFFAEKRYFQELGLQTELIVSFQGARSQAINNLKLNYTYLAIPIFANFYFHEGAALEVGLQPAYLLRAIQSDGGDKIDIKEDVNNWDLSGIIGLSYNKPYGGLGIRYVIGITNTNGTWFTFDTNSKNKVLQLYIAKTLLVNK